MCDSSWLSVEIRLKSRLVTFMKNAIVLEILECFSALLQNFCHIVSG